MDSPSENSHSNVEATQTLPSGWYTIENTDSPLIAHRSQIDPHKCYRVKDIAETPNELVEADAVLFDDCIATTITPADEDTIVLESTTSKRIQIDAYSQIDKTAILLESARIE